MLQNAYHSTQQYEKKYIFSISFFGGEGLKIAIITVKLQHF
jgi:hypothetical protein